MIENRSRRAHEIDVRDGASAESIDQRVMAAAQFIACDADEIQSIARLFEVHRDALSHVSDLPNGTDQ